MLRFLHLLPCLVLAAAALPTVQIALNTVDPIAESSKAPSFPRWAQESEDAFIKALEAGNADDWVVTMGNQAGDMDSMVSALAWAYHLRYSPNSTVRSDC